MILCQGCFSPSKGFLCTRCKAQLRPAPERILDDGTRVVSAFEHTGPARLLAHRLKYGGLTGYADLVASLLVPRLPRLPLVPVPRVWTRQLAYGVDPALEIARRLAAIMAVPVWEVLVAPAHARRRAGGDHSEPVRGFGLRYPVSTTVALVDDVVTTGATVAAARKSLGSERLGLVISANSADRCLVHVF